MTRHGGKRAVRVHGRDAAYLERGDGPAVILVHGLGLSADVWRPHLDALADAGYRVLAPDMPGFGDSAGPVLGHAVAETAVWLAAFARAAAVERAAWVGHSASCQTLLRLAARRPRLVAALVLAAPTGAPGPRLRRQLVGLAKEVVREPPRVVLRVVRQYLRAPLATLGTWFRVNRHHPLNDATRVRAPAVIVLGENDPIVDAGFAAELAASMSEARVVRIEGAAHAVAVSPVAPFVAQVLEFLEACFAEPLHRAPSRLGSRRRWPRFRSGRSGPRSGPEPYANLNDSLQEP